MHEIAKQMIFCARLCTKDGRAIQFVGENSCDGQKTSLWPRIDVSELQDLMITHSFGASFCVQSYVCAHQDRACSAVVIALRLAPTVLV